MATSNVTVALNANDKKRLAEFCEEVGVSVSAFFNMCVKATLRDWAIPFAVGGKKPNAALLAAMKEGDEIALHPEKSKGYENLDDLWTELDK